MDFHSTATAHLLNIEPSAAHPRYSSSQPTLSKVHLPSDNYLPGPTLFPGELIARYHAHVSEYNVDTWAAYVVKETSKFPTGSVAFSCSGAWLLACLLRSFLIEFTAMRRHQLRKCRRKILVWLFLPRRTCRPGCFRPGTTCLWYHWSACIQVIPLLRCRLIPLMIYSEL
jgi:hypothetical protein